MNKIKREISRFFVSGLCAVGTDMFFYYLLSRFIGVSWAKGISFCLGTVTAYLMNKYYTFGQTQKDLKEVLRFIILYIFSLSVNVFINFISLYCLSKYSIFDVILVKENMDKLIAFLLATGASTCINFIGQKFWVFKYNKGDSL